MTPSKSWSTCTKGSGTTPYSRRGDGCLTLKGGVREVLAAEAFATPEIQSKFETPENFLSMVRQFYPAVYRPRSVLFEDLTVLEAMPAQPVLLLDQNGQVVKVVYVMQRQFDGCWRIAGCI
ncbi:MAG: YdiU family protein [Gemmatimonadaceae bacterium]|nr:YdiU family protein [Gloeobacterales cyanobacterium ES-bin-141]